MFIKELDLNIAYLAEQAEACKKEPAKSMKDLLKYGKNLIEGIQYYKTLADNLFAEDPEQKAIFISNLGYREEQVREMLHVAV
jgi:hypothetical protein